MIIDIFFLQGLRIFPNILLQAPHYYQFHEDRVTEFHSRIQHGEYATKCAMVCRCFSLLNTDYYQIALSDMQLSVASSD